MVVTWWDIADMLFPDVQDITSYENQYPERPAGSVVTRFAPSPTGFLHIWGVYSSLVSQKFAHQSDGTFFLRIEDTDQQRLVEGAVELIIDGLKTFGISIDEGPLGVAGADVWQYWPYTQSQRKEIYHSFVKYLVAQGSAYPCWMTTEEIDAIREQQSRSKTIQGIYWNYSVWRNKTPEDISLQLAESRPLVVRLRSHANTQAKIVFDDMLRGKITMADNFNDIPLLKSDGLPTYHLAHIVDDRLMRTTHVIRGEEWLTSVPLHLQLFEMFGYVPPVYCHLAPLLKLEDGKKRKLSKRKDVEANIAYFWEEGYPPEGVVDYLMTIIHSDYENWLEENSDKNYMDYPIRLEDMNKAGALFDVEKLRFMSNTYLSKLSNEKLFEQGKLWAKMYHSALYNFMSEQWSYALAALSIERHTDKDPKRFTTYQDLVDNMLFFSDTEWDRMQDSKPELPEFLTSEVLQGFVQVYKERLDLSMDVQTWFEQLKEIGTTFGFAPNNQAFKQWWYIAKIGDLAMFLRVQLCCSTRTPDLHAVMQVMGKERVISRLEKGL